MPKIHKVSRDINGTSVEQRQVDGFINGTAMCAAYKKEISDWFRNKDTFEFFEALAESSGVDFNPGNSQDSVIARLSATKYAKIFPGLLLVKRGSPFNGGGVWLAPNAAVELARWCNKRFAVQVNAWVMEWLSSAYNPVQLEADADRVRMRDSLKDKKRLEFTGQIKAFLERLGKYDSKSFDTRRVFWEAHDHLNRSLTTETSREMRERLAQEFGKRVTADELIRDYYPIEDLTNFASVCQAAANEMHYNKVDPIEAINRAIRQVLPVDFCPSPINFNERIDLVRLRLQQRDQTQLIPI